MLGDRWSLLIVRDLMVRGYRTFREFEESGEGIATNILSDRLQKLTAAGIIMVREAGGFVTDIDGRDDIFAHGEILAGNDTMHRELLALIKQAAKD